jgi:hypothetical protein
MTFKKQMFMLPLLLTFLGYCGDGNDKKSTNWLSTSDLKNLVAPTDLHAACQSTGHIKVTWTGSFETVATDLEIYRKGPTDADFTKIDEIAVDAGIYTNAVPNGTTFKYRARAIVRGDDGDLRYVSPDYSPETNGASSSTNCGIIGNGDPGDSVE